MTREPDNYRKHFEEMVGTEIYSSWIKMLSLLGPKGRSHRISVLVASMLQYAWDNVKKELPNNKIYCALEDFIEDFENDQKALDVIESLFSEAQIGFQRTNSSGVEYSIAKSACMEFHKWHDMPWE